MKLLAVWSDTLTVVPLTVTVAQVGHVPLFDILLKRQPAGEEETRPLIRGAQNQSHAAADLNAIRGLAISAPACDNAARQEGHMTAESWLVTKTEDGKEG